LKLYENIEKTLDNISIGNYFLNRVPVAHDIRIRNDKRECIILKTFCTGKVSRIKRQTTELEKNLFKLFIRQRINIQNI
jgi:hypothetical protein